MLLLATKSASALAGAPVDNKGDHHSQEVEEEHSFQRMLVLVLVLKRPQLVTGSACTLAGPAREEEHGHAHLWTPGYDKEAPESESEPESDRAGVVDEQQNIHIHIDTPPEHHSPSLSSSSSSEQAHIDISSPSAL